jgi:hypothetical protein
MMVVVVMMVILNEFHSGRWACLRARRIIGFQQAECIRNGFEQVLIVGRDCQLRLLGRRSLCSGDSPNGCRYAE